VDGDDRWHDEDVILDFDDFQQWEPEVEIGLETESCGEVEVADLGSGDGQSLKPQNESRVDDAKCQPDIEHTNSVSGDGVSIDDDYKKQTQTCRLSREDNGDQSPVEGDCKADDKKKALEVEIGVHHGEAGDEKVSPAHVTLLKGPTDEGANIDDTVHVAPALTSEIKGTMPNDSSGMPPVLVGKESPSEIPHSRTRADSKTKSKGKKKGKRKKKK
jgi:hypothetical protein